jgi:hypothetical protein
MKLIKCTKSLFCKSITDHKADKFAKTFVAKATIQNQWDSCIGLWDNDLLGAMIVTFSKRLPKVANLQLLHTFYKHRGKSIGTSLMKYSLHLSIKQECEYFRISAEPDAVLFYQKLGMKMLGVQKSKCQLSMFKIVNDDFHQGIYDINDPIINKAVYKKGKGGCVKIFV